MKKLIIGVLMFGFVLTYQPKILVADNEIPVQDRNLEGQIAYFSDLYGGNTKIISKVMDCESHGDHKTVGDGGRSKGIFQFQKSTFERMEKAFGEDLNYSSQFDQIKLASWALSQPEYANEWTTYVAIVNGGKYSFYSRQLKKHFTVYCQI